MVPAFSFAKSMDHRRGVFRSRITAMALIASIALATNAARSGDPSELSAESACADIRSGVSRLARAERAEADALQLAGQGADLASVASRLDLLLAREADLRNTLRRVSHSRLTHDPDVENCLKLGYRALYEAEKLTTEVEQILLQQVVDTLPGEIRRDGCAHCAA